MNCSNSGAVNRWNCGGICGVNAGQSTGKVVIETCSNSGVVSGSTCGGICAQYGGREGGIVEILNCSNSGNISGSNAGGIVGDLFMGNVIDKCRNTGAISGDNCGGIAGNSFGMDVNKSIIIKNSYSTGNITGSKCGGICGASAGANNNSGRVAVVSIVNCYSLGTVASTCGGIIGGGDNVPSYMREAKVLIKNCYSYGTIADANSGIVAFSYPYTKTVENCYVANNSWTDAAAKAQLIEFPTSLYVNNPGTTWTSIEANTPYKYTVKYTLSRKCIYTYTYTYNYTSSLN
jgi:hypothetical protein